jgi:chemotaxis protein MotB
MAGRRSKGAHAEEEPENSERWLLTYADMITLLMVLFIVLFAIGQVDQKKFDKLHDGLANSFGQSTVLQGSNGLLEGSAAQAAVPDDAVATAQSLQSQQAAVARAQQAQAQAQTAARRQQASMEAVRKRIVAALKKQGLDDAVQFQTKEQRGLVVNIVTDRVLFDLGEATLRPQGAKVLDAIAPALKDLPNEMVIEGHTDNLPISDARFASNWELSTQRATTVLRHLLTRGLAARKVAAAGYADQRPLARDSSAGSRARNRRVAIVILSDAAAAAASTASPSSAQPAVPAVPVVPVAPAVPAAPAAPAVPNAPGA